VYKALRGTVDILPIEQAYWRYIEQKAIHICQLYGYERIDTPIIESTNLFSRSIGEKTDIVEKEMYSFEDKGGKCITLRPEGTASVCRAYIEHGMHNQQQPVKLFYLTPIFRYERPQTGRYRQHYQFGYEAIGAIDPTIDAEVIDMAWHFFSSLGLNSLKLILNSIGCHICRPNYLTSLRRYYTERRDRLCPDCEVRLEKNTLRLLDCKKTLCQEFISLAPRSVDYLCQGCDKHFILLKNYLLQLELPFSVNHRLVRGLDYYTRTVFEIQPKRGGGQSTIGGGGRYDNLIRDLGGKETPALGFATGIERIILNLKKQNISIPSIPSPEIFIAQVGDKAKIEAVRLAAVLRQAGIGVLQASGSKSLKAQLRQANKSGTRNVIITGEAEMQTGTVILRNMITAQQETIPLDGLLDKLRSQLQ
jgi:histidyl-tRNA synthetase